VSNAAVKGFKKYGDFYLQYKGALLWHAHNTFLNIAVQTGVQGLAIFSFLIYKIIKYRSGRANLENSLLPKYFLLETLLMVILFFVRNPSDDFLSMIRRSFFGFSRG
jgi:O-antigen ligase